MPFRQLKTSIDYYKYSFFPLAIVQWHALSETAVCLLDLKSFKVAVSVLQHSRPPVAIVFNLIFPHLHLSLPLIFHPLSYHKNLIIAWEFIRSIYFHKEGGGRLLEATVFDNSWKNSRYSSFPLMTAILISETDVLSID